LPIRENVLFAAERPLSGSWARASNVSQWPTTADPALCENTDI